MICLINPLQCSTNMMCSGSIGWIIIFLRWSWLGWSHIMSIIHYSIVHWLHIIIFWVIYSRFNERTFFPFFKPTRRWRWNAWLSLSVKEYRIKSTDLILHLGHYIWNMALEIIWFQVVRVVVGWTFIFFIHLCRGNEVWWVFGCCDSTIIIINMIQYPLCSQTLWDLTQWICINCSVLVFQMSGDGWVGRWVIT